MGVPSFGGCDEGVGTQVGQNIYLQMAEHGRKVYHYLPQTLHIPVYGREAGTLDAKKVVVAKGPGLPRESI